MENFYIGGFIFVGLALFGLMLFIMGIIFLVKNIKWKGEKDRQNLPSTSNLVGIICCSVMMFFGILWFICFGFGSLGFFIISKVA